MARCRVGPFQMAEGSVDEDDGNEVCDDQGAEHARDREQVVAGGWAGRGVGAGRASPSPPRPSPEPSPSPGKPPLSSRSPWTPTPRAPRSTREARAERDAGPRQRQHHGEHHGLCLEGAPGREDLARSQDAGDARSERLPVQAARDGDHGRSALQDPQLRRHPPQRPHASQGQQGVQPRDAGDAQGSDHDVRQGGGHLPDQVRRPPLDERLRRRLHPSVLLGDERGREVHDLGPRPGDLRDHRLAREAGDADGLGHGWRHRQEDPGLQVRCPAAK